MRAPRRTNLCDAFWAPMEWTAGVACCPSGDSPSAKYAIVAIKGKDLGMVATRDIARGERILAEQPLLIVSEGMKEADLAASVAALTPKDHQRFSDLTCNEQRHGPKSAFGIVATNGIPFRHRGKKHGGLFLTTSRVNHACDANVAFKWNPTTERLTIHALRAIKSGEEITYNYGFDTIFCCRAERQSRLQTTFGFVCLCAKCELKGDALRKSEAHGPSPTIEFLPSFISDRMQSSASTRLITCSGWNRRSL